MDLWKTNEREFRKHIEEHHWDAIDSGVACYLPRNACTGAKPASRELTPKSKPRPLDR